mmetsp:Transcript_31524/g.108422  ORF Transcript_31524/g.108422 Transcript_31524/m.108422 type:complete len:85 (+) Transcript_31524:345-599(+)
MVDLLSKHRLAQARAFGRREQKAAHAPDPRERRSCVSTWRKRGERQRDANEAALRAREGRERDAHDERVANGAQTAHSWGFFLI